MIRFFALLTFVAISHTISAQSQVESLFRDAKVYNEAYVKGDMEKFVSMTIPSVINVAGGAEYMVANAQESLKMTIASGLETVSITPQKPGKIMIAGDLLHSILPQKLVQKIGSTTFSKTTYYLASSEDDGKTWTFLDLEAYDKESIKTFVPAFTGDLEIPPASLPEIVEN